MRKEYFDGVEQRQDHTDMKEVLWQGLYKNKRNLTVDAFFKFKPV